MLEYHTCLFALEDIDNVVKGVIFTTVGAKSATGVLSYENRCDGGPM